MKKKDFDFRVRSKENTVRYKNTARSVNYQLLTEDKRKVQLGIYGWPGQRLYIVKSKAPANTS